MDCTCLLASCCCPRHGDFTPPGITQVSVLAGMEWGSNVEWTKNKNKSNIFNIHRSFRKLENKDNNSCVFGRLLESEFVFSNWIVKALFSEICFYNLFGVLLLYSSTQREFSFVRLGSWFDPMHIMHRKKQKLFGANLCQIFLIMSIVSWKECRNYLIGLALGILKENL